MVRVPSTVELLEVLRNQLYGTIPVLHIVYKADMSSMLIDGIPHALEDAATMIAKSFHIALGSQAAKAPTMPPKSAIRFISGAGVLLMEEQ